MLDLDRPVFGNITAKEIIGAWPPATMMRDLLDSELEVLLTCIEDKSEEDLLQLLKAQKSASDAINSRPGAMALAQDKIRLYNSYSEKYMDILSARRGCPKGVM